MQFWFDFFSAEIPSSECLWKVRSLLTCPTKIIVARSLLSETVVTSVGTFRWMSPELLDPPRLGSNGRPTRESDCYALGMTIYEVSGAHFTRQSLIYPSQVLTGLRPFHNLLAYIPVPTVLGGGRPERPREAESLCFSHTLWESSFSCLGPPSARIDAGDVNDSGSSGSSGTSMAGSMYEA